MKTKQKKRFYSIFAACMAFVVSVSLGASFLYDPIHSAVAEQIHNDNMNSLSAPTAEQYNEAWDWKETAENYLRYVFDTRNEYEADNGDHGGYMYATRSRKIGRLVSSQNMDDYFGNEEGENQAWGMASYIGYYTGDTELGEGITNLAAIASASLIGLEDLNNYPMTDEDGNVTYFNFVKSAVAHYNRYDHIVSNGDDWSGKSGQDEFWYELLPNVLFTLIANEYSDVEYVEQDGERVYYLRDIITESARNRLKAVIGLGGVNANFDHMSYDINRDMPIDNGSQRNADSAAGFAYVLYSAYAMNMALPEEERCASASELEQFRNGAIWSMNYLEKLNMSPFYEVLVYLAPYMAARMNAEQGTNYNVSKMYSWAFYSDVRGGWGMIKENWNGYYTQGLMGSTSDTGGYAFAMNTFDATLGFVPMVRYDSRFAEDISKWILCASQSAQNFYPAGLDFSDNKQIDGSVYGGELNGYYDNEVYNGYHQSGRWIQADTESEYLPSVKMATYIPYEGLRRYRKKVVYNNSSSASRASQSDYNYGPYASGDAYTYNWNGHTDYGMYGGAHVGIFASVIEKTNISRILEIDLNKLDPFSSNTTASGKEIVFKMYYNPYGESKTVEITCGRGVSLFDTLTKQTVASASLAGTASVTMSAGQTMVLAFIPEGETVSSSGGVYACGGVFIAQEKGNAILTVYSSATGGEKLEAGKRISGTVYAELSAVAPKGFTLTAAELSFNGSVIERYQDSLPQGRLAIDTNLLKNTTGTLKLTVKFGEKAESAEFACTVDNRIPTYDIVNYVSDADMAEKWTMATSAWNEQYPVSEHYGSVSPAGADGDGVTVSLPSNLSDGKGYAWITTDLYTVDFSRQPVLKFKVDDVTAKYAVKMYIEGVEKTSDKYTGRYLIKDASSTGECVYYLPDTKIFNDENFDASGVYQISLKITAVGGIGDSVRISDFELYHSTAQPSPIEPDSYEWGNEFSAAHLYNWDASALGENANVAYKGGVTELSASDRPCATASPYLTVALAQNPTIRIEPKSLTGAYFVAIQIDGYDGTYYLRENVSQTDALSLSVVEEMERAYPGIVLMDRTKLRVLIGAHENSVLGMGKVYTYYALPEWGAMITGAQMLEWENLAGVTARAAATLDAGDRAVFTNRAERDNETAVAGKYSSFNVNIDRNPYLELIVRNATGDWRLTLTSLTSGKTYELIAWNRNYSREPITIALSKLLGGELGEQSVSINLEIRGGGNSVTVQSLKTYYEQILPMFGKSYTTEAAAWIPETDAPLLSVEKTSVRIRANGLGAKGILTPTLRVEANKTPIVTLTVDDVDATDGVYIHALIGGTVYSLSGLGIFESGVYALNIRELTGIAKDRAFTMQITVGGSEDDFSFLLNGIAFGYKFDAPTSLTIDDNNLLSWAGVSGAKYKYAVYNANGNKVKGGSVAFTSLNLKNLFLQEGIYTIAITATAGGHVESDSVKLAFKIGDIETVTLGKAEIELNGFKALWSEVANATEYEYVLKDVDSNQILATGKTTERALNLTSFGLTAYNYELSVTPLGDGTAFANGETSRFLFHTAERAHYTATSFAAMTRGDNNGLAIYDSSVGASAITVPNNGNWGNVRSAKFSLNFDLDPVLVVRFGNNNIGGYHLTIVIDNIEYNLCDDTYDYGNGTLYMDINAALESRNGAPYYDGPGEAVVGTHTVQLLFGVTMGENVGTPKVYYKSADVYEMTEGTGTKISGQLPSASVSVSGGKAVWAPLENAESYLVTVSNEFGVLLTQKVMSTEYDLSFLVREGEYSVQVVASGAGYYDSEAVVRLFRVFTQNAQDATFGDFIKANKAWIIAVSVSFTALLGGGFAYWFIRKKRGLKKDERK